MIEVALMAPSKQTDNKLRWETDVDGVNFKLYIPKARVPYPWPKRILVRVCDIDQPSGNEAVQPDDPTLERGITATVRKVREHTETVRFDPDGDPNDWEIGSPYIPFSLLPRRSAENLQLQVWWDRSAGTWSN